jgi:hypothetical protein
VAEAAFGTGGGVFAGCKALPAKANRRSTNWLDLSIGFDAFRLTAKTAELSPRALELKRQTEKKVASALVKKASGDFVSTRA